MTDNSVLATIKGLGPARIKKLSEAKITTPAQVAKVDEQKLVEIAGCTHEVAREIILQAKELAKKKTSPKKKKKVSTQAAARAATLALKDIVARARDHFKKAPYEHVFVLHSGESIADLRELAEAFEEMNHELFSYHVNAHRHDFSTWIREVLQEHALAEELEKTRKHPQEHSYVIYRHITRRVW